MKNIRRNTEVVSISLPKNAFKKLEKARKRNGQSRSAFIVSLVNQLAEEERWQRIYQRGQLSAR